MRRAALHHVIFAIIWLTLGCALPPAMAYSSGAVDRTIEVDDLKLHYLESGAGQTVVLIHGNAGNALDFDLGAIEALDDHYRVIAIDRPGHGASERSSKADTVEEQAKVLHDELAKLGVEHPILVGHSWGGSLALAYALLYPKDLAGMVLLAPAAYPDQNDPFLLRLAGKVPLIGEIGAMLGGSFLSRRVLRGGLEKAFYPQKLPDSYFRTVLKSWLGRRQLKAYFADEAQLKNSLTAMSPRYSGLTVPTVIVTGDHDQIVNPATNAHRLHSTIPGSVLLELRDTGHEIPQTHPESILQAIGMLDTSS